MQTRQLIVVFLATTGVSLVVLLVLFNMLFEKLDLSFETRVPDAAPLIHQGDDTPNADTMNAQKSLQNWFAQEQSSYKGIRSALINVPGDYIASPRPKVTQVPVSASADEPSTADAQTDSAPVPDNGVIIVEPRAPHSSQAPALAPAPVPVRRPAQPPAPLPPQPLPVAPPLDADAPPE
ncbi:MAG: hypothetical protein VKJ06_02510 [Vampirovibrionales bacterium]|nr:hypothetical protein [Vampirovibrionales bacterium]